jgi:hypothetical protein
MPNGHEPDPAGRCLHEVLESNCCAILVQELQEWVVGPNSRLSALAEVVHEFSLLPEIGDAWHERLASGTCG